MFFSSFIFMCIRKVIDWLIVIIILSFASFTYSLPLSSLINKMHLFDVDQIYLFNIAFETLAYLGATHPQPHNLFGFNSFSFFGCPDVMSMYSAYSPSETRYSAGWNKITSSHQLTHSRHFKRKI